MSPWTKPRPLFDERGRHLTPNGIEAYGPGIYELSVMRRGRGRKRYVSVYLGRTVELNRRLYEHSHQDTDIWEAIDKAWESGFQIYYSVLPCKTESQAVKREREYLRDYWYLYPLNVIGNPLKTARSA
jgi:hypothetical protein